MPEMPTSPVEVIQGNVKIPLVTREVNLPGISGETSDHFEIKRIHAVKDHEANVVLVGETAAGQLFINCGITRADYVEGHLDDGLYVTEQGVQFDRETTQIVDAEKGQYQVWYPLDKAGELEWLW